jgi:hypothetical protein
MIDNLVVWFDIRAAPRPGSRDDACLVGPARHHPGLDGQLLQSAVTHAGSAIRVG